MRFYLATDVFSHPARLLSASTGTSSETLMKRARERAFDPAVFDTQEPFFFPAEISNNSLDAYFTRMAPSSLKNYAIDAERGVSFQDSHKTRELGLGATLSGQLSESGELVKVTSDIFTIPGLRDTDAFIQKLRAGIARDVSIGFHGGEFRCSICGLDMFDWDCWHFPGVSYEVELRNGKGEVVETTTQIAIAWIEDARLSEVSIVYDGATPGCGILKATRDVEAGRMTREVAEKLSVTYRGASIRGLERFWPGFNLGEITMNEKPKDPSSVAVPTAPALKPATDRQTPRDAPQTNPEASVVETEAIVPAAPAPAVTPQRSSPADDAALRSVVEGVLLDADIQASDVNAGLLELLGLARVGRQYRADLIEEALKEGVRVWGNEFAVNTYRAQFLKSDIAFIKQCAADWRGKTSSSLPVGRQTADKTEKDEPQATKRDESPALQLAPNAAFIG